ncbi:M20 family metallopeptidase [Actinoplanes couchii]|uniref:Peptidase M20 domain-containing protein 2 n=1 Tax=Actinoplanes couchii TaxID=403638 RepID=A0ABQ3X280_9ACTN|nr:M20 family metallopeptidase [Actinoplanes couchii]MDR6322392.1 amidohydrolase [Actinoplanes couchii]GID52625.1 putative peptidase/amidohydrolase [Actinoplanes couchii]
MEPDTDAAVDEWQARLLGLSHSLHAEPEVAFAEHASAAKLAELMRSAGFTVEEGACGLATALTATYGEGDLTVGVCAEYDALPGIGHGCGHNIICASSAGAAVALRAAADRWGFRIKLLGTPAEESGGGKQLMLERGAFDDVTVAMMAHPGPAADRAAPGETTQACTRFEVTFRGRPAHAAGAPWDGVNAADAAVVSQVAVGLLRQQIPPDHRIAGFVRSGGEKTNIIPEQSILEYEVRTPEAADLTALRRRVWACFEAGALATGATVEFRRTEPDYLNLHNDPWLITAYASHLPAFGRTPVPLPGGLTTASTDMGNISHVVPSIHPMIALRGVTAMPHTHEFTTQAATPQADEALLHAAKLLARTAVTLATDPQRREAYTAHHQSRPRQAP